MRVLGNICEDRENGFNFLRLLAASGILVAHCLLAVPVTIGSIEAVYAEFALAADLLLAVFFVFSGFLITASLERSQNLWRFASARLLRIFPALIVVSLLLTFLLAPAISSQPLVAYFSNVNSWLYVPRAVGLLDASASLPGVFDNNPVAGAINLPIWTLRYEAVIYAVFPFLALLLLKRSLRTKGIALLVGLLVLLGTKAWLQSDAPAGGWIHLTNFSASFLIGSGLWVYRHQVPHHLGIVLTLWGLFALLSDPLLCYFVGVLAAGYSFIWLAFLNFAPLKAYSRRPDYSYGTYIIHFPVAQFIYSLDPSMHPLILTALTFAVTLPLAAVSWALIEKPALSHVSQFSHWLQSHVEVLARPGAIAAAPHSRN